MLDKDFPTPRPRPTDAHHSLNSTEHTEKVCDCPPCPDSPPPLSNKIPEGIDINEEGAVDKLKEWIISYYKDTVFNNCEHSRLPQMTGTPFEFHINPSAKPTACHKIVHVPLHWKTQVKADLDRDAALGVLEATFLSSTK